MSRVGVMVIGPAGAGKSTFCNEVISHLQTIGRRGHIVNLDPAAAPQKWEFTVDIRDLVSVEDVMEEMNLGPNGALLYCFEYLLKNLDWLDEEIGDFNDEFLIFDCPGQIELYTHIPVLPQVIQHLTQQLGFNLCATYLLEASFIVDSSKFFSGTLSAMATMILLELPHINVLSKLDLIKDEYSRKRLKRFLNPDSMLLNEEKEQEDQINPRFLKLNKCIAQLVDDFGMVQYLPLEAKNPDSIATILSYINDITQWAEGQDPKEPNDQIDIEDA